MCARLELELDITCKVVKVVSSVPSCRNYVCMSLFKSRRRYSHSILIHLSIVIVVLEGPQLVNDASMCKGNL